MDALAALKLQMEWGADEALDDAPRDWTASRAAPPVLQILQQAATQPRPPAPARPNREPAGPTAEAAAAAAGDIAALAAAMAAFTQCPLAGLATHTVLPEIAPGVRVLFIDDAPGSDEDLSGRPLSGAAGALFGRMLASIGLSREAVGLMPILPWRPPGGRAPTEGEMAMSLAFVHRAVALTPSALVVPLGALATKALTGAEGSMRRLRGRISEVDVPRAGLRRVLPSYHPGALLRDPVLKKDAWADLLAIQKSLEAL